MVHSALGEHKVVKIDGIVIIIILINGIRIRIILRRYLEVSVPWPAHCEVPLKQILFKRSRLSGTMVHDITVTLRVREAITHRGFKPNLFQLGPFFYPSTSNPQYFFLV